MNGFDSYDFIKIKNNVIYTIKNQKKNKNNKNNKKNKNVIYLGPGIIVYVNASAQFKCFTCVPFASTYFNTNLLYHDITETYIKCLRNSTPQR